MATPAGEITVLRVFGDIDRTTEHVLRDALTDAGRRRTGYLVVDLAGMGFCSVQGLELLVDARTEYPDADYLLGGVEPNVERFLTLIWPAAALPVRHPTAAAAVLGAMASQRERGGRQRPALHSVGPGQRVPRQAVPVPRRSGLRTDDELGERARGGDSAAYRELALRHRSRVYRSALEMLGSSEDRDDVTEDISARLRVALAAFGAADPP